MTTNITTEREEKKQPSAATTKSANKTKVNGGAWQIKQLFNFKYSSFFSVSLLFVACCRHFCCYLWWFAKRASTPPNSVHTRTPTRSFPLSRTHDSYEKSFTKDKCTIIKIIIVFVIVKNRLRSRMFSGHAADKVLGGVFMLAINNQAN